MCKRTRQALMVRALVLESIDPGSILAGGFLEGHDLTPFGIGREVLIRWNHQDFSRKLSGAPQPPRGGRLKLP